MGSVAILQPKDCLPRDKFVNSGRRRSSTKSNPNPNLDMNRSGGRRKNSPGRNNKAVDNNSPAPAKELVMEQVKILKRGEALEDMTNTNTILKCNGDNSKPVAKAGGKRRNPLNKIDKKVKFVDVVEKKMDTDLKKKMVTKVVSDLYAGVGFEESPSPSSLPVPGFFSKKSDSSGTVDLIRGLRFDP